MSGNQRITTTSASKRKRAISSKNVSDASQSSVNAPTSSCRGSLDKKSKRIKLKTKEEILSSAATSSQTRITAAKKGAKRRRSGDRGVVGSGQGWTVTSADASRSQKTEVCRHWKIDSR